VGKVVRFTAPHKVDVVEEEVASPRDGQVLVRSLYSGISTGTELTAYRGTNPYLARRWDPELRLFTEGSATMEYPMIGWGYQEVGEVVEVGPGVTELCPGDVVWGVWGHRSEAVVDASRLVGHVLPPDVDPLVGVFARLSAVAYNAVLDAGPLLGSYVVVFGQGVLGLLTTRLAILSGARVIAVETMAERRELARITGARHVLDPVTDSVAERVYRVTDGLGADVCIEISGSYGALHEAIRAAGAAGRVIASGFYQGPATQLRLGEEFHHNRVQLAASQISGVNPMLATRWQVERLQRTFMELVIEDLIDPLGLVTHLMDVDDVAKAFRLLDERPQEALQAVLRFQEVSR
jgi:2-desacetyl-2-hydroxyethyl bacteriochlorophyllide A dehydrogenase